MHDAQYMAEALTLASTALGLVSPNPSVGCVIVSEGKIVGRGTTSPTGGPHAERHALREAGAGAKGATAYVTLEPCCHYGRTPPCTNALVEAGIKRVVTACRDPDPRVSGRGIAQLEDSGIEVSVGCLGGQAVFLNRGFYSRVLSSRPWTTMKNAISLDGKTATASGKSRWISSNASRDSVHRLRSKFDAVLVGIGTVIADNPRLSARRDGFPDHYPFRIVADTNLRVGLQHNLLSDGHADRTIILTAAPKQCVPRHIAASGCRIVFCPKDGEERMDINAGLLQLGELGINTILVESGGVLSATMLKSGDIDEAIIFRAPILIGGDGWPVLAPLSVVDIKTAPVLQLIDQAASGPDRYERYLTTSGQLSFQTASAAGGVHDHGTLAIREEIRWI